MYLSYFTPIFPSPATIYLFQVNKKIVEQRVKYAQR